MTALEQLESQGHTGKNSFGPLHDKADIITLV